MANSDKLLKACKDFMPKLCDKTVGVLIENGTIDEKDNAEFGALATLGYLFRSPEAREIMAIIKETD